MPIRQAAPTANEASFGTGDPCLFQSVAAVVIGGLRVLRAPNRPGYGRSIIDGLVILAPLLLYGREERQ